MTSQDEDSSSKPDAFLMDEVNASEGSPHPDGSPVAPPTLRRKSVVKALNTQDLATSRPLSGGSMEELGVQQTPSARLASMSTPVSCRGSLAGGTPKDFSASRRRASNLAWFEDARETPSTSTPQPAVVRQHWSRLFDGGHLGEGDVGAGVSERRHMSLMEPGFLPAACCLVPGICLFGMIATQCVAMYFSKELFLASTAALTIYVFSWTVNMSIFSCVGAWRMRRDNDIDWHAKLLKLQEDHPGKSDIMHIVLVPNYKEDAEMMLETLQNIGKSPLARSCIRVVLGMEEREGPLGSEKAEWLVRETSHMFCDIFAAFHPAGRTGELAGKSSNTQWAYREALKRYADVLAHRDPARVFLSVGDADTLWHPQYFDAVAYQGLAMSREQAAWAIWQPPMLLFRNLFAVPAFTRLSAYGTLLFELSGLATAQHWGTHFCFSSYSLTLALAAHHKVGGWDTDVIAEDHHMYCKCFFAALWEVLDRKDISQKGDIEAKVSLYPIYLPAMGYLVESSEGYLQSCVARFLQARRHSQGVAELSYAMLQYSRVFVAGGGRRLTWSAHRKVIAICWKMAMVHIINNVQAVSLLLAFSVTGLAVLQWLWSGGYAELWSGGLASTGIANVSAYDAAKWALVGIFGPAPPVGIMSATAIFVVIKDVVEGRYMVGVAPEAPEAGSEEVKQDHLAPPPEKLGMWKSTVLAAKTQYDMFSLAEPTILLYGMVPAIMASWSLLCKGPAFDYIVAEKPMDAGAGTKR